MMTALLLTACPPKYPACSGDKDCKPNEYCVNNQCQQCRDSKDCKPGEQCNGGRCEAQAQKSCSTDADCPGDQSCIGGVCKPCASDDQCGDGGKCHSGRCARALPKPPEGELDTGKPGPCTLETVYFDFNEFALSTEATSAIDRDAECLKKSGSRAVTLIGRTDPRGTEEYNLALSDKRAQMVKRRLSELGVDGGKLRVVAKGELEATGTDESGWAKDRRVDFQW